MLNIGLQPHVGSVGLGHDCPNVLERRVRPLLLAEGELVDEGRVDASLPRYHAHRLERLPESLEGAGPPVPDIGFAVRCGGTAEVD